ncbi:MAG: hypothetical protein AAFP00_03590 [Bacteroidota bacterium]
MSELLAGMLCLQFSMTDRAELRSGLCRDIALAAQQHQVGALSGAV